MMEVKYTGHGKWCHPETCSCRPYSLFAGGEEVATYYNESDALAAKIAILETFIKYVKEKEKKHGN